MIILDTDHLNVLSVPGPQCDRLTKRLGSSADQNFAISIISVEEQMRGWLAEIHRRRDVRQQIAAYGRLASLVHFWRLWRILPLDELAAVEFQSLRSRVRVGTQDLKIAAVALVRGATLLTRNVSDFERIPGLTIED